MICSRCQGTGSVPDYVGAKFGGDTSKCKQCGFQALGSTQVKQFQARGNLCRGCSGDYT